MNSFVVGVPDFVLLSDVVVDLLGLFRFLFSVCFALCLCVLLCCILLVWVVNACVCCHSTLFDALVMCPTWLSKVDLGC